MWSVSPSISPERPASPQLEVIEGIVTQMEGSHGVIRGEIYFRKSVVVGKLPSVGEEVVAETERVPGFSYKFKAKRVQCLVMNERSHKDQNSAPRGRSQLLRPVTVGNPSPPQAISKPQRPSTAPSSVNQSIIQLTAVDKKYRSSRSTTKDKRRSRSTSRQRSSRRERRRSPSEDQLDHPRRRPNEESGEAQVLSPTPKEDGPNPFGEECEIRAVAGSATIPPPLKPKRKLFLHPHSALAPSASNYGRRNQRASNVFSPNARVVVVVANPPKPSTSVAQVEKSKRNPNAKLISNTREGLITVEEPQLHRHPSRDQEQERPLLNQNSVLGLKRPDDRSDKNTADEDDKPSYSGTRNRVVGQENPQRVREIERMAQDIQRSRFEDDERYLIAAGDVTGLSALRKEFARKTRKVEEKHLERLRLEERELIKRKDYKGLENLAKEYGSASEREAELLKLREIRKKEGGEAQLKLLQEEERKAQGLESAMFERQPPRRSRAPSRSRSRSRSRSSRHSKRQETGSNSRHGARSSHRIRSPTPRARRRSHERTKVSRPAQISARLEAVHQREEDLDAREKEIERRMAQIARGAGKDGRRFGKN